MAREVGAYKMRKKATKPTYAAKTITKPTSGEKLRLRASSPFAIPQTIQETKQSAIIGNRKLLKKD